MTDLQINDFKERYKHILKLRELIKLKSRYVEKLSRFDTNNSHKTTILYAQDEKRKLKNQFQEALNGYPFEHWQRKNGKILLLQRKIKHATEQFEKYTYLLKLLK